MKHMIKIGIIIIIIVWAGIWISAIRWLINEIFAAKTTLTLWIILWVLIIFYFLIQEDKKNDKF